MAIYSGTDGIVRTLSCIDTGIAGVIRAVPVMKCGINGTVRDLINITDQIDHIEVVVNRVTVAENQVSANSFGAYATISISGTRLGVNFKSSSETLVLYYDVYVVFKDTQRTLLKTLINKSLISSFNTTVTGYISSSGMTYANQCLGNSLDGSTVISSIDDMWLGWCRIGVWSPNSTFTMRQTFSSFSINGISGFSTKIVNELT